MATVPLDMWTYRDPSWKSGELSGYAVEAIDGGIGKIDEASYAVDAGFIVVATGPWIFGKRVMLPAGVISRIDVGTKTVFVHRTKDEIKNAPEFDEDAYSEEPYRSRLGGYYSQGGAGWRDW
jgi:hypothetical protein